jgi:hypothetical protein
MREEYKPRIKQNKMLRKLFESKVGGCGKVTINLFMKCGSTYHQTLVALSNQRG